MNFEGPLHSLLHQMHVELKTSNWYRYRFGDAYGLSPAEADVAKKWLVGMEIKEIAALRGSSPTTVKQQLKYAVCRCRCKSRREMVYKLMLEAFAHVGAEEEI